MTKTNNPPAFPAEYYDRSGMHSTRKVMTQGMTLRDYFAGQALQGQLSTGLDAANAEFKGQTMAQWFSENAYQFADAMLAEREK